MKTEYEFTLYFLLMHTRVCTTIRSIRVHDIVSSKSLPPLALMPSYRLALFHSSALELLDILSLKLIIAAGTADVHGTPEEENIVVADVAAAVTLEEGGM